MTHGSIDKLLNALNQGEAGKLIFLSELTPSVDVATAWLEEPQGGIGGETSHTFYFVKNDSGLYIAGVLDMDSDLHVFVKPEYRGKGFLSNAMKSVIFPHLYQAGRTSQSVTFSDPKVGQYIEKNWGFHILSETCASASLLPYAEAPLISAKTRRVQRADFVDLTKKLDRASLYLKMASEQLESMLGKGNDGGLSSIAEDYLYLDEQILEYIEKQQRAPLED